MGASGPRAGAWRGAPPGTAHGRLARRRCARRAPTLGGCSRRAGSSASLACACVWAWGHLLEAGELAGEAAEDLEALARDPWVLLTTEEWQPGRVGEFNTTHPVKDLECEGPETKIRHDLELRWADVKERLHQHPSNPFEDPWLLRVAMNIQRDEPDTCVLGITSTSAFLLPVTMPKFRNMARMLNLDHNFLVLNVTFYDTLRSGFPTFGILDGLATPEYRAWFDTVESREYFPAQPELTAPVACASPAAVALLEELDRGRAITASTRRRSAEPVWRPPVVAATALFAAGEAGGSSGTAAGSRCAPAEAAALLSWALARAAGVGGATGARALVGGPAWQAALRDIIELVSRAEEIVRNYSYAGVAFGELVATPWNIWWLLHQLQLELLHMFVGVSGRFRLQTESSSREEL